MKKLETIIGLEIHAQVNTKTKMFCRCDNDAFSKAPNTLVCPICMGFPGMLPALNEKVVEKSIVAALALNCEIQKTTKFDRKNYFYPDLPKGYQISQFHNPLAVNGFIEIETDDTTREIRINRLHMEDDAGKLVHEGGFTYCDYNRSGTPLIEIVTEPDIRSAKEAKIFAETLQKILKFTDTSDADMYKGMMRFDASVSMRPLGDTNLYPRTEIKNLNSFRALELAILYEERRQKGLWNSGEHQAHMTTVSWDDALGKTIFMRNKEGASDYRYFPEPDIPPLNLDDHTIEESKKKVPELPLARKKRYRDIYKLNNFDSELLSSTKSLGDYFEKVVEGTGDLKKTLSFLLTILLKLLKDDNNKKIDLSPVSAKELVALINEVNTGKISGNTAKEILPEIYKTGKKVSVIIEEKGLKQINTIEDLKPICKDIVDNNKQIIEDYKNGKDKALGALVGKVMGITKGQANPKLVNDILKNIIK